MILNLSARCCPFFLNEVIPSASSVSYPALSPSKGDTPEARNRTKNHSTIVPAPSGIEPNMKFNEHSANKARNLNHRIGDWPAHDYGISKNCI